MEKLEGKIDLLERCPILARIIFDNCWKVTEISRDTCDEVRDSNHQRRENV